MPSAGFVGQLGEQPLDAVRAVDGQRVERESAQEHRSGAQGERDQARRRPDWRTSPVDVHLGVAAHRVDDVGEDPSAVAAA